MTSSITHTYIYSEDQRSPIPTIAWTEDGAFEVAFHHSGLVDVVLNERRYALRKDDDATLTVWADIPGGRSVCRGHYPCAFTPVRARVADIHAWIVDWMRTHE